VQTHRISCAWCRARISAVHQPQAQPQVRRGAIPASYNTRRRSSAGTPKAAFRFSLLLLLLHPIFLLPDRGSLARVNVAINSTMPANLDTPPAIQLNGATEPSTMNPQPSVQNFGEPARPPVPQRNDTSYSKFSTMSVPPEGSILTGKQEHCKPYHTYVAHSETDQSADLKRELISQQTKYEIAELSSPTALRRFGAPFRSDAGEVAPEDSELPLLRYIFVNHVRNFPFLDKAKEKEFWQDKLQVVCCIKSYRVGRQLTDVLL
jgi:hypothetical protein